MAHWLTLHGMVTVTAVLLYVITSHAMQQRRNPTASIAWVLFILLAPYAALPAYLMFGSRKQPRPHSATAPTASHLGDVDNWSIQAALALGQPPPAAYRDLNVHRDGDEAILALLEVIDAAQQSIDLCTFILKHDNVGTAVVDRLCSKARDGVRVRVLVDGLGRLMAGPPALQRLSEAGGTWALFAPPLTSPLRGR
jgi:cardiolipin synthase